MKIDKTDRTLPIPINDAVLASAQRLKDLGLPWSPHVGCFVWDRDAAIQAPSPFPRRIYFILNMRRFTDIFGSRENMRRQLVWVPTWHQAFQLCRQWGIAAPDAKGAARDTRPDPEEDGLLGLYDLLPGQIMADLMEPE
ncbi:hypothetical protein DSCA_52620 [Desulfosarcina alkanivorans]|jgi:hypothetical protein|uniref:Uncharacterized protein n=1 Tax=Desulfosarcina alkanivorans TaxID=571177 RepID=A0A5K7YNI3_9BACT|nr:hypothetical protein [Desulfosarcina alkanivorans]BBO71332.1 hypothetical protein DSCA_52620 [Desulfosarcina alkanivorans]